MRNLRQAGLSMIELMIALVIGSILMLGLIEVFSASRTAYQVAEGMGRVQENGRFALDFLQRDLRMVGHMGCVNDQARALSPTVGFRNRLNAASHPELEFVNGIRGYEATGTGANGARTIVANPAAGAWTGTPALPGYISGLDPAPLPGSDILQLRFFSPEGIPVISFTAGTPSTIKVAMDRWDAVIKSDGFTDPGLLGIADCISANTFQATTRPTLANTGDLTVALNDGLNGADGLGSSLYVPGQTMLYRAESEVFYIGLNGAGQPSLYRARFTAPPAGSAVAIVGTLPEELVEGVENMQLMYGTDNQTNTALPPSGFISGQFSADAVPQWQRVGQVRVGLLTRSADRAASPKRVVEPDLLGVNLTLPDDGRYRAVYESTIALRNRLYGN